MHAALDPLHDVIDLISLDREEPVEPLLVRPLEHAQRVEPHRPVEPGHRALLRVGRRIIIGGFGRASGLDHSLLPSSHQEARVVSFGTIKTTLPTC